MPIIPIISNDGMNTLMSFHTLVYFLIPYKNTTELKNAIIILAIANDIIPKSNHNRIAKENINTVGDKIEETLRILYCSVDVLTKEPGWVINVNITNTDKALRMEIDIPYDSPTQNVIKYSDEKNNIEVIKIQTGNV